MITKKPSLSNEVWALINAACDGELSLDQQAKLAALLDGNPEAQAAYIDHIRIRRQVRSWWRQARSCRAALERIIPALDACGDETSTMPRRPIDCLIAESADGEEHPSVAGTQGGDARRSSAPRLIVPPLVPLPLPLRGAPLPYLIAALLVGVGLLAAWKWETPVPPQPAAAAVNVAAESPSAGVRRELADASVARVTRLVECHWIDQKAAAVDGERVMMGRKFTLASGKLEITYNTGTRLTLQGPAIFVVEAHNGGLLALGRATARVGTKEEMEREAREQGSLSRRHVLFGIRTPTATMNDDDMPDTEYEVVVSDSGTAFTRVVRGKITFHVPRCPAYWLVKDYCGITGTGPNHDGLCIFVNGKEPSQFTIELPHEPPVCTTDSGATKADGQKQPDGADYYLKEKGT